MESSKNTTSMNASVAPAEEEDSMLSMVRKMPMAASSSKNMSSSSSSSKNKNNMRSSSTKKNNRRGSITQRRNSITTGAGVMGGATTGGAGVGGVVTTSSNNPQQQQQQPRGRTSRRGSITMRRRASGVTTNNGDQQASSMATTDNIQIQTSVGRRASITMRRHASMAAATSGNKKKNTSSSGDDAAAAAAEGVSAAAAAVAPPPPRRRGPTDKVTDLAECDEVRDLALQLAPDLEETEKLFRGFVGYDSDDNENPYSTVYNDNTNGVVDKYYNGYDDDNFDHEMESLEKAQDLLRQELEQQTQQGFEQMYGIGSGYGEDDDDEDEFEAEYDYEYEYEYDYDDCDYGYESGETDLATPESDTAPAPPRATKEPTPSRSTTTAEGIPISSAYDAKQPHQAFPTVMGGGNQVGTSNEPPREQDHSWYPIDMTDKLVAGSDKRQVKEYCLSVPDKACHHLFAGIKTEKQERANGSSSAAKQQPRLPVRTLTMRVRPDASMNAIMDACGAGLRYSSSTDASCTALIRRNGGQLTATITMQSTTKGINSYTVDIQLCTCKTDECERVVLIRVYHKPVEQDENANNAIDTDEPGDKHKLAHHLRKCCTDVRRRESTNNRGSSRQSHIKQEQQQALATGTCPSVNAGSLTFPALNESDDWPLIKTSEAMILSLWHKLETRNLSYHNLVKLGAHGGCIVDEHYCAQIEQICREVMVMELMESTADMEDCAVQAELHTANLIALLRPQFLAYGMAPPSHPAPVPLRDYPLNYKVKKYVHGTLERMKSWPTENLDHASAVQMAERAVEMVVEAFIQQDDEEQMARVARKKRQVMDRLTKMRAHQQAMVQALCESPTDKAFKAAEVFASKAALAVMDNNVTATRQVPLLKVNIVVGGLPASAFVTASDILFVKPQLLSKSKVSLFHLHNTTFHVQEGAPRSFLNPLLSTLISVKDAKGQELYHFRPKLKESRLLSFLDVIKSLR